MGLCWNITTRCNENCKYCHRFLGLADLSEEENTLILERLVKDGVNTITWTGGEALLIPYLPRLMAKASAMGVTNRLITNGQLLTEPMVKQLAPYLDRVSLSIDSFDSRLNQYMGRGSNHAEGVERAIYNLQTFAPDVKIIVNSVVSKVTANEDVFEVGEHLKNYNIETWKLFKFMPLREQAVKSRELFEISDEDYFATINQLKAYFPEHNIDTRVDEDMETKYLLVLADGSVFKTENGEDKRLGNMLDLNFSVGEYVLETGSQKC